jgi:hypothetical protein
VVSFDNWRDQVFANVSEPSLNDIDNPKVPIE